MLDWTDALVMAPRVSRRTSSWARQPATLSMVCMGQAIKDLKVILFCSLSDCLFLHQKVGQNQTFHGVPLLDHTACMVQHIPSKGISRSGWGRGRRDCASGRDPQPTCLLGSPSPRDKGRMAQKVNAERPNEQRRRSQMNRR